MSRTLSTVAAALLLPPLLLGCGKPRTIAGDTPRATAEAFVKAVKAEQYDAIAAGWDYETYARTENPDWDSIPEGQRKQIINKLMAQRAEAVKAMAGMFSGDVEVREPQVRGNRAMTELATGTTLLRMMLIQEDGVWKILALTEQGAAQHTGN